MNKNTKKKVMKYAKVGISCLAATGMVVALGLQNKAKACGIQLTDLNESGKYAVFANNCEVRCDMEGNVAAKKANLNGVHIGLTSSIEGFKTSYIQEFVTQPWCAEFLKSSNGTDALVIGNQYGYIKDTRDNCYWITYNGNKIFKAPLNRLDFVVNERDSSYQINFDESFTYLKKGSKDLFSRVTNTVEVKNGTNYNRNGSIVCKDTINVVNLTMAQYNAMYDFNIVMDSDATLVINMVDYNGQNLDNKVTINGSRPAYKGLAGKVLWNFGSYDKTVQFAETTQGCILAPFAKVCINSTHNGNVIADTVTNPGGEIHKNDFTGLVPSNCSFVLENIGSEDTNTNTNNDNNTNTNTDNNTTSNEDHSQCPEAAKTYSVNFSNSEYANLGTLTSSKTIGDVTINANSSKTVKVANDKTNINGVSYTKSLMLGGTGNTSYRSIKVPVKNGQTIAVVFRSNNTSATRTLAIADANGNKLTTMSASTTNIGTYKYTGNDGYVYIYSTGSGINVYDVEVNNCCE
ncbi:MAG: choice-of-anchor A family protein [Lachnospiraceae bacterium]|nr:choice-of-anchor A family protein [Lachnospiraceae bacterium]